ncbi:copper homeostasis membrane protein CopD [Achromobacter aegrifaciens]
MLAAFALCRFLATPSSVLLFGASAMLALSGSRSLSLSMEAALRRLLRAAAATGVLAVLCLLPLQAVSIAEDWRAATDLGMLGTVAFQTRYGLAWCLRMVAVLLVLAVVLRADPGRGRLRAVVTGAALLSLGLSGHAAMEEGWAGYAHAANDMLHCLAAGFWLGSLPVFLLLLRRWQEPARRQDALRAVMRFSNAGHVAVAVLLISGIVNAALILRSATLELASSYQQVLAAKILLALAMVALAVINRYRWVPRIRGAPDMALRRIRRNTIAELCAGGAVLLLVGLLGLLPPS